MTVGRFEGRAQEFRLHQEDAWERTAQTLCMLHNSSLVISRSLGGGEIKETEFKTADDFNLYLKVPGAETPDDSRRREEDEIIAERKRIEAAKKEADGK